MYILNRLNLMRLPVLKKEDAEFIEHADTEPLREECAHFLECMKTRNNPSPMLNLELKF